MTDLLSHTEFRDVVYDMCGERWWNRESPLFDFLRERMQRTRGVKRFARQRR